MKRRILHVADVHLDSPLHGLARSNPTIAASMQKASRGSFAEVVRQAIEFDVSAVVIAGDLFDGPIRDAGSALWVESQFKKLEAAKIPVALILGNHDALSGARRVMNWPTNVHQFGSDSPSSFIIEDSGLAIHGQSFGARAETQDLASRYPSGKAGYINIGMLHTSLSGSGAHNSYAPTSVKVLEGLGYDYWALGHIHLRNEQSLSQRCFIGYSGNTQGRHIRESGPKGCWLAEFSDDRLDRMEFLATDQIRWHNLSMDISSAEHLRDIEDLLDIQAESLRDAAEGRPLAIRVTLTGQTKLHGDLSRPANQAALGQSISQRLSDYGEIWLEAVKIRSTPFIQAAITDVLQPLKYLSRVSESCRTDPIIQSELESVLEELFKNARHELSEAGWNLESLSDSVEHGSADLPDVQRFVQMAENMLVARLAGGPIE